MLTLPQAFRRGITDDTTADLDAEKKQIANSEIAKKWLGKTCLAGWPYQFKATVVEILTQNHSYKLKDDIEVTENSKERVAEWQKVSEHLAFKYSKRMGILLENIDAIAVVKPHMSL